MRASKQRGMGIFNLLYVLVTLAVFGYVGLKAFPLFLEGVKVDRAIKAVASEPGAAGKTKKELAFAVVKRLDVDGSYRINELNWKEYLNIKVKSGRVDISANYQAEVLRIWNFVLLGDFAYRAGSS